MSAIGPQSLPRYLLHAPPYLKEYLRIAAWLLKRGGRLSYPGGIVALFRWPISEDTGQDFGEVVHVQLGQEGFIVRKSVEQPGPILLPKLAARPDRNHLIGFEGLREGLYGGHYAVTNPEYRMRWVAASGEFVLERSDVYGY